MKSPPPAATSIGAARITVRRVLELVATYPNRAALFHDFPDLVEADIRGALAYAAASIDDEVIELPHAG